MSDILITEHYKEIKHYILEEKCPVCGIQFKVGDTIELVERYQSRGEVQFNVEAVAVHTTCEYVKE